MMRPFGRGYRGGNKELTVRNGERVQVPQNERSRVMFLLQPVLDLRRITEATGDTRRELGKL